MRSHCTFWGTEDKLRSAPSLPVYLKNNNLQSCRKLCCRPHLRSITDLRANLHLPSDQTPFSKWFPIASYKCSVVTGNSWHWRGCCVSCSFSGSWSSRPVFLFLTLLLSVSSDCHNLPPSLSLSPLGKHTLVVSSLSLAVRPSLSHFAQLHLLFDCYQKLFYHGN